MYKQTKWHIKLLCICIHIINDIIQLEKKKKKKKKQICYAYDSHLEEVFS